MNSNFRKEFIRRVKRNGYEHVRTNGSHMIFQNTDGRTLPINLKLNEMVARRLVKEYGLR